MAPMKSALSLSLVQKRFDDPLVQIVDGHITSLHPPAEVTETPPDGPHR
jgi:hypothetical protein